MLNDFHQFILALALSPTLSHMTATLPGESVYQVPAVMTNQSGHQVAWESLRGRPVIVSMFSANCRMTCPMIVQSGRSLQKNLSHEEKANVQIVLISIDPKRDTPSALMEVARTHRLDLSVWQLLRPSDSDLRTLAAALGVNYRELPDGTFSHTSVQMLLDAEGRVLARGEISGPAPDPAFVASVREHLGAITTPN